MKGAVAITVREGDPSDYRALMVLDQYAASHHDRSSAIAEALANGQCFTAESDGEILGYAVLNYSFFGFGFIPIIVVAEKHRRCGVGSELLREVRAKCTSRKLFTSANLSNIAAAALFESAGFVRSGLVENLDPEDPEVIYFQEAVSARSVRVLVTGAAGSGTSTLGRALAREIGARFVEADDHFWVASDPPFQTKRSSSERRDSLLREMARTPSVVVAGSVVGWGAEIEDGFSLVVFLSVPTEVRLARIKRRELDRFGKVDASFLEWAAQYEEGRLPGRSRAIHEQWLSDRRCTTLRIEGEVPIPEAVARMARALSLPTSIKGVLFIEGGVVLVKNPRNEWELPGGRIEPGESPETTLAREFAEELSIRVHVGAPIDSYVFEVVPGRSVRIVTYGCTLSGAFSPRISDEHSEYCVCPIDELGGLNLPRGYRQSIERWWASPAAQLSR